MSIYLETLDCSFLVVYNNFKHLNEGGICVDTNRVKRFVEWYYSNVFKDEAIRRRSPQCSERLPSPLRAARSLENTADHPWQSRESIFLKQAKLLADYEDNYEFQDSVAIYFPTYQSLTDQELRGYFSWRTRLRRGDIQKAPLSFAFLYIYELLNQIGVADPMDGYQKLEAFRDTYGQLDGSILLYLKRWLTDYVVYYDLDASLLADTPQVLFDRNITILENAGDQSTAKVIWAIKQFSPNWLERSRFYAEHREDMDIVIQRVLRRVSEHYATRCKKTMAEQYFGSLSQYQVSLFSSAVFCDPLKKRNCEYVVDERYVYRCKNGLWTVQKHDSTLHPNPRLNDLMKTVDCLMREEYHYGHPIICPLDTKWLLKLIREEIQGLQAEKKAADEKKITIDFSKLSGIRRDAAITRDKLIVEEELEETSEEPPAPPPVPADPGDTPLSPAEYRLLQCLLYGRDYGWVQAEGYILSVLLDSINDKLYDVFLDAVLDDTPMPIEDYIDDLKEMVHP